MSSSSSDTLDELINLGLLDSSNDEQDSENVTLLYQLQSCMVRQPRHTSALTGREYCFEILNGHLQNLFDQCRMYREPFDAICTLIRHGDLLPRSHLSVEESLMIFLKVISQAETNRVVQDRFNHSGETIARHFRRVLRAMCILAKDVILPPKYNIVPPEIRNNPKYWPWFKDCVGAIDETHIAAVVPTSVQQIYRGRKSVCTQNIMAACSFDMLFTYVYTRWEGIAADSRILQHALHDPSNEFPRPPEGKYYVVDSGYSNMPRFLTPYRGERYHLASYRNGGQPTGPMELFNYRHSSLRNCIEKCFGILKARFPILKHMTNYKLSKQRLIPITCCVVHNLIKMHARNDPLFHCYNVDQTVEEIEGQTTRPQDTASKEPNHIDEGCSYANLRRMSNFRDSLADQIWEHHLQNRG